MGYRFDDKPPVKPEDMLPKFAVRNGATTTIAFPCMYIEIEKPDNWHDHHVHDFIGWPYPGHPDHICQNVPVPYGVSQNTVFNYVDMNKATPIMLKDEGYDQVSIIFDPADGITFDDTDSDLTSNVIMSKPYIDDDEPWVVKVDVKALLASFADKPMEFPFTLFAHAPICLINGKQYPETNDEVARAKVVVLPGNIPS